MCKAGRFYANYESIHRYRSKPPLVSIWAIMRTIVDGTAITGTDPAPKSRRTANHAKYAKSFARFVYLGYFAVKNSLVGGC